MREFEDNIAAANLKHITAQGKASEALGKVRAAEADEEKLAQVLVASAYSKEVRRQAVAATAFAAEMQAAGARYRAACNAAAGLIKSEDGGEFDKIKDALLARVAVSKICSLLATWRAFKCFTLAMVDIALKKEVDGYVLRNGLYVRA